VLRRTQGFTLVETIVALVVLAVVMTVFIHASISNSSQATSTTANVAAAHALTVISSEINVGNPTAMTPTISSQQIAALSHGQDPTLISTTLTATVTRIQSSDPPQYKIAVIDDKGNGTTGTATGPGGTP
jgi:prepilin-type N-terminal cleavage/methylation domain-containing protein